MYGCTRTAKGTASFGLACATGKVASAEAEALETWAQRVVRPVAVGVSRGRRDVSSMWRVGPEKVKDSNFRGGAAVHDVNSICDTVRVVRVSSASHCLSNLGQSCCRRAGYGGYLTTSAAPQLHDHSSKTRTYWNIIIRERFDSHSISFAIVSASL